MNYFLLGLGISIPIAIGGIVALFLFKKPLSKKIETMSKGNLPGGISGEWPPISDDFDAIQNQIADSENTISALTVIDKTGKEEQKELKRVVEQEMKDIRKLVDNTRANVEREVVPDARRILADKISSVIHEFLFQQGINYVGLRYNLVERKIIVLTEEDVSDANQIYLQGIAETRGFELDFRLRKPEIDFLKEHGS